MYIILRYSETGGCWRPLATGKGTGLKTFENREEALKQIRTIHESGIDLDWIKLAELIPLKAQVEAAE